jgi:hypothetical protein
MNPLLTNCPVCQNPFHVERLGCAACGSVLEGLYSLDWLGRLSRDQLEFVRVLVKNRGNINGVAADLRMAYNTARSRLDDIVAVLGDEAPVLPPASSPRSERPDRISILDQLNHGAISVEEAIRLLRE